MYQRLLSALLTLVMILAMGVFAKFCNAQADNSKILNFDGGKLDASISLASNVFYGIGGRASNLAGTISSFSPQPQMSFWNPATLAWLSSFSMSIDLTPPLSTDVGRFFDLNSEVEQSTLDGISVYRAEETIVHTTDVGMRLAQSGASASGAIAVPIRNFIFHASFYRPIDFHVDVLTTGFKTKIMTTIPMSDREEDVFFNSFLEGPIQAQFGVSVVAVGLSYKFRDNMALGLTIENYSATFRANGMLEVNGTMLFAGQERAFNDPRDLWYNNLNQSIDSNYRGNAFGAKLGYTFRPTRNLSLDAVFSYAANLVTSGNMNLQINTVPALNIDPTATSDKEEEIFDHSKLDLSRLTLTQSVSNKEYPDLTIHLPNQLRLGAAYRLGSLEAHLSYGRYFHEFSFGYGDGCVGLKLKNTLRLGFDFKYVQLGLGFINGETVLIGSKVLQDANTKIFIPLLSLGSSFRLAQKYSFTVTALSVPMPILRMSVGYQF